MSGCYMGEWRVGKESFYQKSSALLRATETKENVSYHFYDDIWDKFDRSKLGKISLDQLYLNRAKQLRDSYDYLILYYSGGADSRNILLTFLDNNIKLDQICVKWPVCAVDKGIYPITTNREDVNYMCEWDLVIKPDLEKLSKTHPEIKIEIIDWFDGVTSNTFLDSSFDGLQQFTYMCNMLRVPSSSKIEKNLVWKGKKVASIYGIDKPLVGMQPDGSYYMYFQDTATTMNPPRIHNPHGAEYFYWSPEMPEIVFEQCYLIANYFRQKKEIDKVITNKQIASTNFQHGIISKKHQGVYNNHLDVIKSIIYSNYDQSIFQAQKPLRGHNGFIGTTKDFYLETHSEIKDIKDKWMFHWKSWISQIDPRFYNENGYFVNIRSKKFLF